MAGLGFSGVSPSLSAHLNPAAQQQMFVEMGTGGIKKTVGIPQPTSFLNSTLLAFMGPPLLMGSADLNPFGLLQTMTGGRQSSPAYGTDQDRLEEAIHYEQRKREQSDVEPAGPRTAMPERGASEYPDYRDMIQYAEREGSLDGTPVTANSTYGEDFKHLGEADETVKHALRAFYQVLDDPTLSTDGQRDTVGRIENGLGYSPPSLAYNLRWDEAVTRAFQQGELETGGPLHRAHEPVTQALQMQARIHANLVYKWSHYRVETLPDRILEKYYGESPFNRARVR